MSQSANRPVGRPVGRVQNHGLRYRDFYSFFGPNRHSRAPFWWGPCSRVIGLFTLFWCQSLPQGPILGAPFCRDVGFLFRLFANVNLQMCRRQYGREVGEMCCGPVGSWCPGIQVRRAPSLGSGNTKWDSVVGRNKKHFAPPRSETVPL